MAAPLWSACSTPAGLGPRHLRGDLIGFLMGIARLSPNWLLARLAGAYVEIFRNIPLLLQIFFWYFAVLRSLPSPRQSAEPRCEAVFLNNPRLVLPAPVLGRASGGRWCAAGRGGDRGHRAGALEPAPPGATGHRLPAGWISAGLIVALPAWCSSSAACR